MLNKVRYSGQMLRHFGAGWMLKRAGYLVSQKTGLLEYRMKSVPWDSVPLGSFLKDITLSEPGSYFSWRHKGPVPFFFTPADLEIYRTFVERWDGGSEDPVREASETVRGVMRFFRCQPLSTGFPPDWHKNPMTSERVDSTRHWSRINEFAHGDIKTIWEMSRFTFVYPLVRAYWRSCDEIYAEAFWTAVESWCACNPPNHGINWMCGQEISFRIMAWVFGLYGFLSASATTPERVSLLAQMIAVSGRRIAGNIGYALSQRNNHGISEAMGLWTVGLLFPEFHESTAWKEMGRKYLEREGRRLIYEDGAFSQHSLNYHRLMLHDYLWATRLGDLSGCPLSDELKARIEQAGEFLYQLMDRTTGRVPNYGHNDGSLVLSLTNCDYSDYRPVIQSTWYGLKGKRVFDDGPWDEELFWLYGPKSLGSATDTIEIHDLSARQGGYYTLRSEEGFAFIRCASFRDRPGQADQLHTDIWWHGRNIAIDAGTYSYNAPSPWDNALERTCCHNTVTVDGLDQMDRVGRFLWLPWIGAIVEHSLKGKDGRLSYLEGRHNGFERLKHPVRYRRGIVRIGPDHWLVLDDLLSLGTHDYRLHWLLTDVPFVFDEQDGSIVLDLGFERYVIRSGGYGKDITWSLVRGDSQSPRGWVSEYYHDRRPALSLAAHVRSEKQLFYTILGPEPVAVTAMNNELRIEGEEWLSFVALNDHLGDGSRGSHPLISKVSISGSMTDEFTCG